jgi:hypothetical protein
MEQEIEAAFGRMDYMSLLTLLRGRKDRKPLHIKDPQDTVYRLLTYNDEKMRLSLDKDNLLLFRNVRDYAIHIFDLLAAYEVFVEGKEYPEEGNVFHILLNKDYTDLILPVASVVEYSISAVNEQHKGFTPIGIATIKRNKEAARILMSLGAEANTKDKYGKRAMYYYVTKRDDIEDIDEWMNILHFEHDQRLTSEMLTIVHIAVMNAVLYNMNRLFNYIMRNIDVYRIDLNLHDINGLTPLFYVVGMGRLDLFNDLVRNGADVRERDIYGNTLLHYAKTRSMIDELVLHGLSIHTINANNKTPLDVAIKGGFKEAVETYIFKYGMIPSKTNLLQLDERSRIQLVQRFNREVAGARWEKLLRQGELSPLRDALVEIGALREDERPNAEFYRLNFLNLINDYLNYQSQLSINQTDLKGVPIANYVDDAIFVHNVLKDDNTIDVYRYTYYELYNYITSIEPPILNFPYTGIKASKEDVELIIKRYNQLKGKPKFKSFVYLMEEIPKLEI